MARSGYVSKLVLMALGLALQSGCYGFTGGGLPPHIRNVAILPFDNATGEVSLTQEVSEAVRQALENRLGLNVASEEQADAVVRGTITRYAADQPLSFQQTDDAGNISVTRRLVQIAVSVEIYDLVDDRVLWERGGMRVEGEYEPPGETEQRGRELALEKLVADIVDGAQSQW